MDLREIDFSNVPYPLYYEQKCPICRQNVRFIDDSRRPDYWKDIAEHRKKRLEAATKHLKDLDEWCVQNIGDSYTAAMWRKLLDELREKYNRDEI